MTNGTIALQMAIKALELKGDIIISPFTWVATLSAIQWEGCSPIFCDINPETLNIDPSKIEEKINDKTVAIMPVHVFGNPCDVISIEKIARKHRLKVIEMPLMQSDQNIMKIVYSNMETFRQPASHATKLLNTGEGGGCITKNSDLAMKLKRIRFFGHNEKKDIVEQGFNGKLTEIHAALGLANLNYYDDVLVDRKK